MSPVIDQLAQLTGFRDRDVLDTTLVSALKDLFQPLSVGIYRSIGEEGRERWHTRARLAAGDVAATADPLWADPTGLPALHEHPHRAQCMRDKELLSFSDGSTHRLWFPLVSGAGPTGVLEFDLAEALSAEQQRMVCSILRVYRNVQGLLDYSERDTLTGLLNRKTFDDTFMKSTSELLHDSDTAGGRRHRGANAGHWLGVIDIDHFKRVNDGFGHLIGDEVLLLVSRLMRAGFRHHDGLYRFGGEEFVVLMRCAQDGDAMRAFDRFRRQIEAYAFPQVGRITVSIGVSQIAALDTPSSAFERADKAVYHAKNHGRNQVASHAELLAGGHLAGAAKVGDIELF